MKIRLKLSNVQMYKGQINGIFMNIYNFLTYLFLNIKTSGPCTMKRINM